MPLPAGLVVLRASYGPASPDLAAGLTAHVRDDVADVTIPIQALVHNSQLHIPGGHPKVRFHLLTLLPLYFSSFPLGCPLSFPHDECHFI